MSHFLMFIKKITVSTKFYRIMRKKVFFVHPLENIIKVFVKNKDVVLFLKVLISSLKLFDHIINLYYVITFLPLSFTSEVTFKDRQSFFSSFFYRVVQKKVYDVI